MDCIYSGLSEGAFMSIEQQKIFAKPPQSYWMASTPKANYPTLEEDIKVDVAIIGGGITGIATSYMLGKAGVKVAVIEADRILQGTTGHTTAKITSQHDLIYSSRNRYDVVFLINGIPVFFVETKAAHREDALGEALEQVARYHRETPEAMKVLQIYTLTQVIHFFYAATWSFTPKALFNWKVDKETKLFEDTVKTSLISETSWTCFSTAYCSHAKMMSSRRWFSDRIK